jgi:hypothetical protein
MMLLAELLVLGHTAAVLGLGWLYFGRYTLNRPPIGVFGLADVGFLLGGILVVPLLYLLLPLWAVAGLLALGALSALNLLAEPVWRVRWLTWTGVVALSVAEIGLFVTGGPSNLAFMVVRNAVTVLVVVAIANLWAQSGMKARDATILGACLTAYDFVATSQLPLMGDLVGRVAELPFAPLVAWPVGPEGAWTGLGLGDLLLAAVFPLVLRKAYGRRAGIMALGLAFGGIAGVAVLAHLGAVELFPVMVVLGPLMVLQYAWWARRRGSERTIWEYRRVETQPGGVSA